MKIFDYAKAHPVTTVAIVVGGGLVFYYLSGWFGNKSLPASVPVATGTNQVQGTNTVAPDTTQKDIATIAAQTAIAQQTLALGEQSHEADLAYQLSVDTNAAQMAMHTQDVNAALYTVDADNAAAQRALDATNAASLTQLDANIAQNEYSWALETSKDIAINQANNNLTLAGWQLGADTTNNNNQTAITIAQINASVDMTALNNANIEAGYTYNLDQQQIAANSAQSAAQLAADAAQSQQQIDSINYQAGLDAQQHYNDIAAGLASGELDAITAAANNPIVTTTTKKNGGFFGIGSSNSSVTTVTPQTVTLPDLGAFFSNASIGNGSSSPTNTTAQV